MKSSEICSGTSSKRHKDTSSEALNSSEARKAPDKVSSVFWTFSAVLRLRSSSIRMAADKGKASAENNAIGCSTPSSKTRKSFCWRSVTSSPALSLTVTGTTTRDTVVRIRARESCVCEEASCPPAWPYNFCVRTAIKATKDKQIAALTARNFHGHFMCVPSLFPRRQPPVATLSASYYSGGASNTPSQPEEIIQCGFEPSFPICVSHLLREGWLLPHPQAKSACKSTW